MGYKVNYDGNQLSPSLVDYAAASNRKGLVETSNDARLAMEVDQMVCQLLQWSCAILKTSTGTGPKFSETG